MVASIGGVNSFLGVFRFQELAKMQCEEGSIIREIVDMIVREADPDAVILFGSRARGDARPDSDVDLLIVERDSFSPHTAAARKLRACTWLCARQRFPKICCFTAAMNSRCSRIRRTISSAVLNGKDEFCMRALDYAQGLLAMARKDFDALRGMVDNPLFADEIFGFHAQQAIEKSLNG